LNITKSSRHYGGFLLDQLDGFDSMAWTLPAVEIELREVFCFISKVLKCTAIGFNPATIICVV